VTFFVHNTYYTYNGVYMRYYLFKVKKDLYHKNDQYLYRTLKSLKNTDDFCLGLTLFNSVCDSFDVGVIKNYFNLKYDINGCNNVYSFNDGLIKLNIYPSKIIIDSNNDIRELLKILNIYDHYIFACDFKFNSYFWVSDYLDC